jgi:hypothetical protein
MLLFVIGLPSAFAEWCDRLVMRLAERALGPIEVVHANTLQEIALHVIATGTSQAVVSSRQPGGRLRAALVEGGRRFVVATGNPGIACAEAAQTQDAPLPATVQAIASSCAGLMGIVGAPGALVISADRDALDGVAIAAAIASHFELSLSNDDLSEIVHDLEPIGFAAERHGAGQWWSSLPAAAQEMAFGAIGPYLGDAPDGHLSPITWTHDLFFLGDRPNERTSGPIDITGRARCLIEGPHIMLPPGSWSLSLTMQLSREAAEHEFLVEICTDHPLASGTIRPQQEGGAGVTVDFALGDSAEHPIAIRVSSLRAAFDGAITVVGATLVRAASAADAPPAGLVPAGD